MEVYKYQLRPLIFGERNMGILHDSEEKNRVQNQSVTS